MDPTQYQSNNLSTGATLHGIERLAVFNRLRAVVGLRWELPPLLKAVDLAAGSRCLEIGTGLGWGTAGLLRKQPALAVITTDYEGAILQRARNSSRPNSRARP